MLAVLLGLPLVAAPEPALPLVAAAAPPALPAPAFDLAAWEAEMELGPENNGPGRVRHTVS